MKIHALRLAAFGPFAGEEYVDFDAFAADGLFLIEGRTGAGKSSILDAISYALFERAPRYGTAAPERLRSDHAGPRDHTFVELTFSTAEGSYRVTRSPKYERPKARGEGMTTRAATSVLEQRIDGDWVVLSTLGRETGTRVHELVQLNADQFLQVILLAQNRFGEFLRAKSAERLPLLRTLFASARFDRFQTAAKAQADLRGSAQRDALREETRLAEALGDLVADAGPGTGETGDVPRLELDPSWPEPQLEAIGEIVAAEAAELAAAAESAEAAAVQARTELVEELRLGELVRRRDRARAEHAELGEGATAIDADRLRRDIAARARGVLPTQSRRSRADAVLASAEVAERGARVEPTTGDHLTEVEVELDGAELNGAELAASDLDDRIGAIAELIGVLGPVAVEEATIPTLVDAVNAALAAEQLATQAVRVEEERQAELPETAARLRANRADALLAAAVLDAVIADAERAEQIVAATERLSEAEVKLSRATTDRVEADHAQVAAATAHRELLDARLSEFAGTLAQELTPGAPCPVCGSREHPQPAALGATAVTAEDIAAAAETLERATEAVVRAGAAVTAVASEYSAIQARTAGRDVGTAIAERASAREAVSQARTATADAERLLREIAAVDAELAAGAQTLSWLEAQARAEAERHAQATLALARVRENVAEHHGAGETVAARLAGCRTQRAELTAWRDALRARDVARTEQREAAELVVRALTEHGFSDESALVAGALDEVEFTRLEVRIAEYDTALAGVRARLAEPEIVELGDRGAPDTATARDRSEAAQQRRDSAATEWAQQRLRQRDLARSIAALREARAGSGAQREQAQRWANLSDALAGGETNARRTSLESYVLAAELTKIVAEANTRLAAMTAGRFALVLDDSLARRGAKSGLGLRVFDGHTGRSRDTETLSGGETFLTSLALALGLAEVVTQGAGGVRLDTLFIDEGFGSLDSETLDVAMATLDGLRSGGRTIGVISHVPALQERIPARLRVRALPTGGSTIEHDAGELPIP